MSSISNQYFREGRVFAYNLHPPKPGERSSFLWELISAQPPGTSDTSRMATDHINNPNAINAIFNLRERVQVASRNPKALETMGEGNQLFPGDNTNPRYVPHILKDGADSVGIPGATIRVYVNIGLYSEYWLTRHKPLLGVQYQQPFEVKKAQKNSVYWRATEDRLANVAAFLSSVKPMHLEDAGWVTANGVKRSGKEFLTTDQAQLKRGKEVFAEKCAKCHSSKRPPGAADDDDWYYESVLREDFLDGNSLSEDKRHSIGKIKTNAARALGTNAKRGRIWDNFSSETYKDQPVAESSIRVYNPITEKDNDYVFDLGAKDIRHSLGYYRTPSLISIWTSAPFLHNNSLGAFNGDPSVEGRLEAFEDAAEKLLWPEKRDGIKSIVRMQHEGAIQIPMKHLPKVVRAKIKLKDKALRAAGLDGLMVVKGEQEVFEIGPIPKGTPINLLANLDMSLGSVEDAGKALRLADLAVEIKKTLLHIDVNDLEGDAARNYMKEKLLKQLLDNSKCPDLVTDRGHTFGAKLPDEDKRALIEFLKTF